MYMLYNEIHVQYVYLVGEYLHVVSSQTHFHEIILGFTK